MISMKSFLRVRASLELPLIDPSWMELSPLDSFKMQLLPGDKRKNSNDTPPGA